MTITTSAGEGSRHNLLEFTENLYREAAEDLMEAIAKVKAELGPDSKEVHASLRELRSAFHTILHERTKVEKLCQNDSDHGLGERFLDLDAARDEIGRRLACLRNAGNGDGVSERS
jgi:hypothetical protein